MSGVNDNADSAAVEISANPARVKDLLPFSAAVYDQRLTQLQSQLTAQELAGLLLFNPENIYWLTGYQTIGYFTFQALFVDRTGPPVVNAQMSVQFAPGAPWNDTYWHNDRMGELLKLSLAELDPEKRHQMYCEMQTLIHNGSGMVIPAFANVNDGVANNVMGVPRVPIGPIGGCEWPEFAWLA